MRLFRYCRFQHLARGRWPAFSLLLCCWLLLIVPAHATHIVGGELELTHGTGESYTLTLNLYFDAVNGDASLINANLTASIFDKATNSRMLNVAMPLISNALVNYNNPACARASLITRKL